MIHHVSLVKNDADFVVVTTESFNRSPELIGYVKFVSVEQKNDAIHSLGEPFQHAREVVASVDSLLLAR